MSDGLVRNWLTQVGAVTATAVRTIPQRRGASAATVFGIAGVVVVFIPVLSIGEGFRRTMRAAGSPDNALILRNDSDSQMMSVLLGDSTDIIAQTPGTPHGAPAPREAPIALSSAELFVVSTCRSGRREPRPTSRCGACSRPPSRCGPGQPVAARLGHRLHHARRRRGAGARAARLHAARLTLPPALATLPAVAPAPHRR